MRLKLGVLKYRYESNQRILESLKFQNQALKNRSFFQILARDSCFQRLFQNKPFTQTSEHTWKFTARVLTVHSLFSQFISSLWGNLSVSQFQFSLWGNLCSHSLFSMKVYFPSLVYFPFLCHQDSKDSNSVPFISIQSHVL